MKDDHKFLIKCLLHVLWVPIFALLFGFIFNKHLPDLVSILILVAGFATIHFVFTPKSEAVDLKTSLLVILALSVMLGYASFWLYEKINETSEEFIEQYSVEIVEYDLDIVTTVYFYNKDGEYCKTDLGISKIVYTPEDYSPDYGDIILVDEYKGFFGNKYYRFIKNVYKYYELD